MSVVCSKSEQKLMKYFLNCCSYCYEDERGIFPEVEFVYDLELPEDFKPSIGDGEVEEFFCWPIEKVIIIYVQYKNVYQLHEKCPQ